MTGLRQAELFDAVCHHTPESVWKRLNNRSSTPVAVTFTRNRVSMATVSFADPSRIHLRLHEAFLRASDSVLDALSRYVRSRRRADWAIVAEYARSIQTSSETVSGNKRAGGEVHNLDRIAREVNKQHFNGRVRCRVEWGRCRPRKSGRGRGRSIRFGSWHASTRTVRIHPALDDRRVPEAFVAYIVFHEMLHAVVPGRRMNGRRYDHPPEFRKLERAYPDYPHMQELAASLLTALT